MSIEVEVDGVGILEFPDTMSQEDMRKAILSNFAQEAPAAEKLPQFSPPTQSLQPQVIGAFPEAQPIAEPPPVPFSPQATLESFRKKQTPTPQQQIDVENRMELGRRIEDQYRARLGMTDDPSKQAQIRSEWQGALRQADIEPISDVGLSTLTEPIAQLPRLETESAITAFPDYPKAAQVLAGTQRGVIGLVEFFLSPLGIATLGTGMLPRAAQKAVAGAFAVDMATHTPEIARELYRAIEEKDLSRSVEFSIAAAGNLYFTAKSAKHALQGDRAKASEAIGKELLKEMNQPHVKRAMDRIAQEEALAGTDPRRAQIKTEPLKEVREDAVQEREAAKVPLEEEAAVGERVGGEIREPTVEEARAPTAEEQVTAPASPVKLKRETYFHGTREQLEGALRPGLGKNAKRFLHEEGIWFAPNRGKSFESSTVSEATRYAGDSGTIIEAKLTLKNPYYGDVDELVSNKINAKWLKENGYDGFVDNVSGSGLVAVLDPSQITEVSRAPSKPAPTVKESLTSQPAREAPTVGAAGQGEQPPPSPVSKPVEAPKAEPDNQREALAFLTGKPAPIETPVQQHSFKVGDKVIFQGEERTITRAVPGSEFVGIGKRAVNVRELQPVPKSEPLKESAAEPEPQAQGGTEIVGMGGATPAEFKPDPGKSTSIKNAKVDEERQARGLAPILRPARLKNAVVWDRVMAKIDKEPGWQDQLIDELKKKTRNISQDEVLALDHRYVDLQNEYAKATRDGAQAYADKFQSGVDEAKARIDFYEGKLSELEKIAQETGSEWGRSGQMRQRLMKEDFTLEAMEARLRAQKNFEPLTDAERLQISELHRKLAETQAEAADAADKSNARILILQAEKALADARAMSVQQPSYAPGVLKMAENFASFMDKKADLARARLREKLSRMSAGVDPTILADVAIIGAAKITRGTLDFARWSREMAGELGDWIKPHLDAAWEASQKLYEEDLGKYAATKKLPKEKVKQATEAKADIQSRIEQAKEEIKAKATEEGANLHTPTKKLVKAIVEQNPNIGRDELIDAVHEALRESVPDISRTDAMAAMVDPKRKRPDISTDVETMRLRGKLAKIKSEYNLILSQERAKRLSRGKKILRGLQRSRGAVVNIASSFDFSAMRQALPALLANSTRVTRPQLIGRAFRDMFIGWAKESTALRIEQQILNRENHLNGLDAKVEYTSLTTEVFTKYEENAHSILDEWAALELRTGKLPKTVATLLPKLGARGVRMSNRAFSTFLNRTRADLFDELMRANFKDRAPTQTEADAVANMVNIATGRGKLGPKTGQVLSEAIWAPKLLSSRVQAMTGQPFYQGNAKTRRIVAKEYARMLIGGSMLYFVSRMFDEKDEEDPTSSDYGKIVRGDTRVDPWGGFQQVTVVGARAATGKTKSISGKIHSAGADRKYGERGIWYVLADFGRSKLRPDVATAVDVVTRTRFTGEPTTVKSVAEGLLVPLPLRDVKAIMKDRGMTEGAILETLNIFGAGVSHYDNTPREKASGK